MLTQGNSGASRSKYCSSAISALSPAAASQPVAATVAPRSASRGHSTSSTAATPAATRYGSVVAMGPAVNGHSQGSASSTAHRGMIGMGADCAQRGGWGSAALRLVFSAAGGGARGSRALGQSAVGTYTVRPHPFHLPQP